MQDERERSLDKPQWTAIVPFYNEAAVIETVLDSLAAQIVRPFVILVDNASTDDTSAVAIAACERHSLDFLHLVECRPGKVAALANGLRHARTSLIATCDADTYYPPDYLARAEHLLGAGCAMAGAWFVAQDAGRLRRALVFLHVTIAARLLPSQCLNGGAGQVFHRELLQQAGGFDPANWNLVLEDHEVCHRLGRLGAIRYSPSFWCDPGDRPRRRPTTRWTAFERTLYHLSASRFGDWFFYTFLRPRLERRRLVSAALRESLA